jgi:hypothetical protein
MNTHKTENNAAVSWSQQPAARLRTDKGNIVLHVEGRSVCCEGGQFILSVNDKGVLVQDGAEYPLHGKLSTDLLDVTEQLRVIWLEDQKRDTDYVNSYEERQDERRERYNGRAEQARAEGHAAYQRAHDMAPNPPDQPILIGHHSEGRHRRTLAKMDNLYRHAFVTCEGKASHYESKAEGVGRGGVSGDDPEAVRKLLEQLQTRIERQEIMKACNAAIRHNKTPEKQFAALVALGQPEANARELLKTDYPGQGFARFQLTNNNAEIKRLKTRLTELQAVRQQTTDAVEEHEGFTMKIDSEENRIMFIFDGKPEEETRRVLKSYAFKWSPSRGAWVRKITANALADGKRAKAALLNMAQ